MLRQRTIWFVLVLVAAALVVGWLALGLPSLKKELWTVPEIAKMFAFRLAAYTDLPLLQLLVASFVGWLRSKPAPVKARIPIEAESKFAT